MDTPVFLQASEILARIGATAFGSGFIASADAAAGRSALGLIIGTNVQAYSANLAALSALTVGTGANNLVQLTAASKLPAVDGSLLTNLPTPSGVLLATGATTGATSQAQTFTNGISLASSTINHLGGVDVPILKLRGGNAIIWGGGGEAIRFVRSVEITAGGSLGGISFAINDGSGGQYLKLEGGNNYGLYFSLRSGSPSWDTSIQRLSAAALKVGNSGTGYGALAVETLRVNSSVANTNTPSGTTARAMPIYDVAGSLLGYIPVYAAQW